MTIQEEMARMFEACRQVEEDRARMKASGEADQLRWDWDFLDLAEWYGKKKSKDPSTKAGAVITRGREIVSIGYNGFAKKVKDLPERYADRATKYRMVIHAEVNAHIFA